MVTGKSELDFGPNVNLIITLTVSYCEQNQLVDIMMVHEHIISQHVLLDWDDTVEARVYETCIKASCSRENERQTRGQETVSR